MRVHPKTQIGHIHLTVEDLNTSLQFYRDILGFEVSQELAGAVFLSAGGYHHHIGLNTWKSKHPQKPQKGQIGLYHFAILYPNRTELANALKRLLAHDRPILGASDHGVSEAIYLEDPDGNGIELYTDRDEKDWPRDANGNVLMYTRPLDIDDLLKDAD